ncbi:hypothetical protein F4859DRAFT_492444 [Xylaria cf. heliscus]|nr:hypothetical protein F4859DRAFT_492444 [Xylaria cf. heliscus]
MPLKRVAKPWKSFKLLGTIFAALALSLLAIGVVYSFLRAPRPPLANSKSCNCGKSIAEAREMGCEFDEMSPAWLPPHCIDRDLLERFQKSGDGPDGRWQYWADINHTRKMTPEEVGALADTPGSIFFTTFKWHTTHCFFYLWKIQRSRHTGGMIEARYDNDRHTKHCGEMFEDKGAKHTTWSYVTLEADETEAPEFLKDINIEDV